VVNGNGAPLDDVVVEMPLDPGLDPPTALTQGTAPIVGGGNVPCTGSYDSLTRTVTWVVSRLEDGQGVVLSVTAPTRADLAADTLVVESAEVFSAVCPDRTASNQQVTPVVPPVLQVFKNSDRSTAIVGDGVVFRFEVRHAGSEPDLVDVVLVDTLPPELRYVPGSARVDGEPFPDPLISPDGLTLSLPLGDLMPGEQRFVSLATIVIPTAEKGEIVNRAYGQAVTLAGRRYSRPPPRRSSASSRAPSGRRPICSAGSSSTTTGTHCPTRGSPAFRACWFAWKTVEPRSPTSTAAGTSTACDRACM
jgi:uncharacterized repeat protein (TIGR01451 family)